MATRIPINKENFDDRQKKIWENMEHDMERRRREWDGEIEKMRHEFFKMRPEPPGVPEFDGLEAIAGLKPMQSHTPSHLPEVDDGKAVISKDENGRPQFQVKFNMQSYRPEEINVKMDSSKIMVSAKHEQKDGGSSLSREYNREVNIPREVDPLTLQCTLNPDGYLIVNAPLPVPKYHAIGNSEAQPLNPPPAGVRQQSSYQMSSNNAPGGIKSQESFTTSSSKPTNGITVEHNPPTVYATRQQQQFASPSQQQQHSNSGSSHMSSNSTKSAPYYHPETADHPDHVVPSFKPPPDLSKLDVINPPAASNVLRSASPHILQASSMPSSSLPKQPGAFTSLSSSPSSFHSLHKPPPFGTLSSTFPAGPIFPDSSNQAQLSAPVVTSHDGKFQLTMPIDDYKPEELSVKTQDNKVIISAKRQVSDGNHSHTMEMTREHSLPDNVDPFAVKAFFTDTNNLIVEAPFNQ